MIEPVVEAPIEPQPEPSPEPVPEPQPEPKPEHSVPLAKYLETRDENKELRRWKAEQEAARQQPQRPDPLDDPDGFRAELEGQFEQRATALRFEMSNRFARQAHGEDVVSEAVKWAEDKAKADPLFAASYMRDNDPIGYIVRQHKQSSLLTDIGDNVDDWFAREAAKRGYVTPTAPSAVETPQVPAIEQPALKAPPRSIASDAPAPNRTVNPMAEFNAIFTR